MAELTGSQILDAILEGSKAAGFTVLKTEELAELRSERAMLSEKLEEMIIHRGQAHPVSKEVKKIVDELNENLDKALADRVPFAEKYFHAEQMKLLAEVDRLKRLAQSQDERAHDAVVEMMMMLQRRVEDARAERDAALAQVKELEQRLKEEKHGSL